MKWYRSLYWKIFLAIWLSSALVVLATVLIVGGMADRRHDSELLETRALDIAERLVARYETGARLPPLHDEEHHRPRRFLPPMRIIAEAGGNAIYDRMPTHGPGASPELVLEVTSDTGQHYRVEVAPNPRDTLLTRLLGLLVSVQIVLIMLVSALTSLLLTWLVVRPLNRLRVHTRALTEGDLASRSGQRLTARGDEIGELAREFDTMAEYVERTLGASQRLMQDVSHELRAPLARMQAAAGLLEQRLGDGDPLVERLNRECARINRLIDEILSLSRIDALEPGREPFSLHGLLVEVLEDVRFQAPDRSLSCPADDGCRIAGNRQLLERALGNVFNNALKYTPAGSALEVQRQRHGDSVELRIRDHGPGVAPEQLDRLFEPFFRRAAGETDGYGLGLSIARRALARLGGSICAANHPAGGLEILIRLPVAVPAGTADR